VNITKVQQWVASAILMMVGFGVAIPLAWVGPQMMAVPEDAARGVPLWVMSAVWGMATMAGVLLIHRRRVLSPWLLIGALPAALAAPGMF